MAKKELAREYPPADEPQIIQNLLDRLRAKIIAENAGGIMRRDAHTKMHGLVRAEFIVEPDLPQELRVGVFSKPATYKAWIRFSNQNLMQADIVRDIRGMAIKLMGVPGRKILEGEEDATTHDFVLISTNAFMAHDVREFDDLIKALMGNWLDKAWYFATHWRLDWNLFKSMLRFANPLQIRYFTPPPALFGTAAVKYSAIPHVDTPDTIPDNPSYTYLREAMVRTLDRGPVRFDFAVQFQTDADAMPIEDPGHAWSEKASPFRKIATIVIPQQTFDTEQRRELGEILSFNPWHCLPEHRPLGGINRARKVIYQAISKFRHEQNKTPRVEPTDWEA